MRELSVKECNLVSGSGDSNKRSKFEVVKKHLKKVSGYNIDPQN